MNQPTESSKMIDQSTLNNNDGRTSPARETRPMIRLDDAFVPTRLDVMCGRGKMSHHHVGNHRFRDIIERSLKRYNKATNKVTKSNVVTDIVDSVREEAKTIGGAGFIRQENAGYWVEIGDTLAREKVGHALRDCIKNRKKRSERKPKVEPPLQYEKQQAMFQKQQSIFLTSLKEDMGKDHQETTDYVMKYFRQAKTLPASKTTTTTTTKTKSTTNNKKKSSEPNVAQVTPIKEEGQGGIPKTTDVSPPLTRRITFEGDALRNVQEEAGFPVETSPILRRVSTDEIDCDMAPPLTNEDYKHAASMSSTPPPPSNGKDHSRRVSMTDVDCMGTPDLTAQHSPTGENDDDDCHAIDRFMLNDDFHLPLLEDDAMIFGDIIPDQATSVAAV